MHPILKTAIKAARQAGGLLLRYRSRLDQISVVQTGRNEFVSELDRLVEEDIVATIRQSYPDHAILAEESGTTLSPPQAAQIESNHQWIIDPLDGTNNYLHGHNQFCISIAVRHNSKIEYAVIFDPLHDELYSASSGQGAQLNERRIRVSTQNHFTRALLASGFPTRTRAQLQHSLAVFTALRPEVGNIYNSGCAALDLAYVAAGKLDGYWQSSVPSWRIAAGILLVREAGGLVADFAGNQNFLDYGEVVAANQKIFNTLLTRVKTETNRTGLRAQESSPAASAGEHQADTGQAGCLQEPRSP